MEGILQQDSLQTVKDTATQSVKQIASIKSDSFNWWVVIAILELVLIFILFYKLNKEKKEHLLHGDRFDALRKAKSQDIDMTNLMNSINSSKDLYKKLSRKCHPDRFQDEKLKMKADKLFQHISKNKRNYSKLIKLKQQAEQELNIKF